MDVVVIGAGGHGRDVAAIALAAGCERVELLDDERPDYRPVMCAWSEPATTGYLIGLNRPEHRERFDRRGRVSPSVAHPRAFIGPDCILGPGAVVGPLACLSLEVTLGRHVHVNAGATLVRVGVGDYSTIAPGVHIGGDVEIGAGVFVGIGARVANLVRIGDGATIGAGAVVLDDVPAGAVMVGAPARALEVVP